MVQKKRPGRDAIMDAAEELFSQFGYHGVSLRDITGLAQVELGLASYHFKTKDELFRQVVERRAEEMMNIEMEGLAKAVQVAGDRTPTVEAILGAFVNSRFDMMFAKGAKWARYSRLSHHFLALQDRGRYIGSFREASLDVRAAYVSALCAALPSVLPERIGTIFDLVRLTLSGLSADTENLVVRSTRPADRKRAVVQIIAVFGAGLRNAPDH